MTTEDDTTNWYVCTNCRLPCDTLPAISTTRQEPEGRVSICCLAPVTVRSSTLEHPLDPERREG